MSQFRTPRRRIVRDLDDRRRTEADIKYRHYVRPYGNRGLHIVKAAVDGREFTVSGPGRTFQPGTVVPTGSNTGTQGEFIVTDPPPGRRGAGNYAPTTIIKHACPVSLTGRRYIGIYDSGTTDVVQAWDYRDGTPVTLLDTADLPAELQGSSFPREHWELITPTKVAFIARIGSTDSTIAIWNFGSTVGRSSWDTGDALGKLIYTGGVLWTTKEEFDSEHYTIQQMNPVAGAGVTQVADISVSFPSLINGDSLVIIAGVPWIRSHEIFPPGDANHYVGDGLDNLGPALSKITGTGWGGHQLDSGKSFISLPTVVVDTAQGEQRLSAPSPWFIPGTENKGRLPLSTNQEYMVEGVTASKFARLRFKDYSGLDSVRCPIPVLPIAGIGGQNLAALLPL